MKEGKLSVVTAGRGSIVRCCYSAPHKRYPDIRIVGEANDGQSLPVLALKIQAACGLSSHTVPDMGCIGAERPEIRGSSGVSRTFRRNAGDRSST